jgi:hypothetical protein
MRFGLDGERYSYLEIGQAIGVGRERSRQIERAAIVKLKRRRDPSTAFSVGLRTRGTESTAPPAFGMASADSSCPTQPDVQRMGSKVLCSQLGGTARGKSGTIIGDGWKFRDSRWAVVWDGAVGKVAARKVSDAGKSGRSITLATVPAAFRDGLPQWLERMRRWHEWEPQSLAFLVGALCSAIPRGTRFRSPAELEAGLGFD